MWPRGFKSHLSIHAHPLEVFEFSSAEAVWSGVDACRCGDGWGQPGLFSVFDGQRTGSPPLETAGRSEVARLAQVPERFLTLVTGPPRGLVRAVAALGALEQGAVVVLVRWSHDYGIC